MQRFWAQQVNLHGVASRIVSRSVPCVFTHIALITLEQVSSSLVVALICLALYSLLIRRLFAIALHL